MWAKPRTHTVRADDAALPAADGASGRATPRMVGVSTITAKNQVSLPAQGVRELGWAKGDRLLVQVMSDDTMVLRRRPENWTEVFAGRLRGVSGPHDEVLRYLEEERRSW